MKTKECKDHRLYRATLPGRDTGKGHKSLLSLPCANHAPHTVGSAILTTCALCLCLLLSFSIGLWNCQSAVNKADFITSITSHSRLNLMALTETWIKPEDTADCMIVYVTNNKEPCYTCSTLQSFILFPHPPFDWKRWRYWSAHL